ncbi:MAG: biopolymer transporter ExbD [Bacteroidaceae bacterium]|nr:biopolymer transporter ExbD [Prevotellaceae bacterium]MDY5599961.1 biopolymer transporter ExbD [Bacteroidaceae bacterium]MEE1241817.1 biopolymer transporter ExbD [Bacteroidaceae bacterium]
MGKKKKKVPGLNQSSTADISFILLIFFLITTSMDTDMGLARRLPRPPEENQEDATMDIKSRNILYVRMNSAGQLWVKDEMESGFEDLKNLRNRVKEFVKNEKNLSKYPEKHVKNIDILGQCFVTDKHVISVQTDRGTPYAVYFEVQNELVAAYNELRNELSKQKFGRPYDALGDEEKVAVRAYYPQNISEAEPKKYGGQK